MECFPATPYFQRPEPSEFSERCLKAASLSTDRVSPFRLLCCPGWVSWLLPAQTGRFCCSVCPILRPCWLSSPQVSSTAVAVVRAQQGLSISPQTPLTQSLVQSLTQSHLPFGLAMFCSLPFSLAACKCCSLLHTYNCSLSAHYLISPSSSFSCALRPPSSCCHS